MTVSGSLAHCQSLFRSPNNNVAANRNELPAENSLATCQQGVAQAADSLSGFAVAGQASRQVFMVGRIDWEFPWLMVSS